MRCPHCGHKNRATAKMCAACGRSLGVKRAQGAVAAGRVMGGTKLPEPMPVPPARTTLVVQSQPQPSLNDKAPSRSADEVMRTYLRIAIMLVIALCLVGAGIYFAVQTADGIFFNGKPEGVSARVCQDLTSQRYDDLTSLVDPAPTPNAPDTWQPAVVRTELRQEDKIRGQATGCQADAIVHDESGAHTTLRIVRSSGLNELIGLDLVQGHDGVWRISRATNLTPGL